MIIICEKCSTKFNVPDGAIGEAGRQVKCSSCAHTWHVVGVPVTESKSEQAETKVEAAPVVTTPVEALKEEEQIKPIAAPAHNHDEMKASPRRFVAPSTPLYQRAVVYYGSMLAASLAIICFVSMSIVFHRTLIVHKIPSLQAIFDQVGLYNNEGLKLELVDCSIREIESSNASDDSIEIEVAVSVLNTSEQDRKLSSIRFSVYNIEREYVGQLVMPISLVLAPNKNTKVEGRLNRVPKNSFYVAVDLGNNLDLKILNPDRLHKFG